jgi:glycosyltransferase involved in cell wall biosynthesis
MKLIIQIPCYNEADTLPDVLADLPTEISGISEILVQVIDDGSTDRTVEIAKAHGVSLIVRNKANKGLASSFQSGIDNALRHGADIIVNTDGDNQYAGSSIRDLVAPIVAGEADIVLGDRNPGANRAFSPSKRFLQRFGSGIVRQLAGIEAPDAVTGFRAYSRQAALQINVMTRFSYTIETLIHAGRKGLTIKSVPVTTNPATRESRLFKSTGQFVRKQLITVVRSCIMYMPLRSFFVAGLIMLAIGLAPVLRFLYFYMIGEGDGKLQSLVIGGAFLVIGYVTMLVAFLSDTIATNRQLSETALAKIREIEVAVARLEKPSKEK